MMACLRISFEIFKFTATARRADTLKVSKCAWSMMPLQTRAIYDKAARFFFGLKLPIPFVFVSNQKDIERSRTNTK